MTPSATAATVTASGPHATPSVCNQTVGNSDSVVAYRLADGDCVIEFKRTGTTTWTVPDSASSVQYLIVGGGASGTRGICGVYWGQGGGGGEVLTGSRNVRPGVSETIVVGSGGARSGACPALGNRGETSTFSTLTARPGQPGNNIQAGNAGRFGGTSGNGNAGGVGTANGSSCSGGDCGTGGGGGAGGAGGVGDSRNGGAGLSSSITGSSLGYGGGGAGSNGTRGTASDGGSTGGDAASNRGGGGADGIGSGDYGGAGGSGIVIVRYTPDGTAPSTSVSISATYLTLGTSVSTVLTTNETLSSVTLYYSTSANLASPQSCGTTSNPTNGQTLTCTIASSDATYYIYSVGTDSAGNIEAAPISADDSIIRDTTAPTVTNVSSSVADGRYGIESVIPIRVTFSETVTASLVNIPQSSLRLTVETGATDRTAYYSSGSGSTTLVLNYTVQAGDNNPDLDYVLTTSLYLVAGSVRDAAGNDASLTLPTPGASGSLGANKNIVIDTTAPSLLSASVSPSGSSIVLTYNETLSATVPNTSRFLVSDSGTSLTVTTALTSGPELTLTTSSTINAGRVVTLSYLLTGTGVSGNQIMDLATNFAAYFDNQSVTNNSGVLNSLTTPTTLAVSSSETNTATFTYTPTTNASSHTLRLYDSATSTLLSTTTSFTSGSSRTGLTPATPYYATLQAVGDGITYESSTTSSPLYFTTAIRNPVISSQPSSLARTAGQSATFSVIASSPDTATLSYQWQKNSANISGETASTLSFASTSTSDSATYRVIVTNAKNGVSESTTSTSVTLTVSATLAITTPVSGLTAVVDSAYALSLSSSGGSGGNSFAISTGTLPAGLTINASTGAISGTPTSAGTSAITVRVTDSNSATATTSAFTITVNAANQSITFGALSNRVYGSGTFTLSASDTTTSGLAISYTSATPSTCTLSGADSRTVTLVAIGTCTINANQAGNANYNPASQVQQSFTITAGSASVSIAFASTTFTFGVTNTITITTSTAGVVSFKANGKIIKYCKSRATVTAGSITATCAYRPSTRRPVAITATLTPTDTNIAPKVSTSSLFQVVRRTGARG